MQDRILEKRERSYAEKRKEGYIKLTLNFINIYYIYYYLHLILFLGDSYGNK